ncbi:MAG: phosphonate C-P lyase system protein PhnG [Symbiobacteriaceae bacterium]|nr:phosphonate C-P lyase system protein PhnG [Symbiobacteriaceae bacterium]
MSSHNLACTTVSKLEFSRTLASADREAVLALAGEIERSHTVELLKEPSKTLVMLRARESVKGELFNLGELLAIECLVRVDGHPGISVLAGSDADKCRALALLDAAHSAKLAVMERLLPRVAELEEVRQGKLRQEAQAHAKTQVRFKIMEDRE